MLARMMLRDEDLEEKEPTRLERLFDQARSLPGVLAGGFVRLVYPPVCAACGEGVGSDDALCARCWGALRFITRPYCERLGTPFAYEIGGTLISPAAMADPPVFARARAVCAHDGPGRDLIHRLKYGDRLDLVALMAGLMARAGSELIADAGLIVPVPLHRARLWGRRFNQAAALAARIGQDTGLPVDLMALRRVKRTRPQVGLSRAERASNLQGAIRVPPSARPLVEGRRVLLVDDVFTTGSTANASARALLKAGASAVDVLTFSRVIPGE
jgi:ComF family protein